MEAVICCQWTPVSWHSFEMTRGRRTLSMRSNEIYTCSNRISKGWKICLGMKELNKEENSLSAVCFLKAFLVSGQKRLLPIRKDRSNNVIWHRAAASVCQLPGSSNSHATRGIMIPSSTLTQPLFKVVIPTQVRWTWGFDHSPAFDRMSL